MSNNLSVKKTQDESKITSDKTNSNGFFSKLIYPINITLAFSAIIASLFRYIIN